MKDLIAKLEQATGPSRKLDYAIARALHPDIYSESDAAVIVTLAGPNKLPAPEFTRSIDAALTLVPEGASWHVSRGNEFYGASVNRTRNLPAIASKCATAALAMCIAALTARA